MKQSTSRVCPICHTTHNRTAPLCQRCYQYNRRHPEGRYPLPSDGEIHIAPNGDIVCHECGEAHSKLIQHVYYAHHMSKKEYCDRHHLFYNVQLTSHNYHKKMHDYTHNYYDLVVKENLINNGHATRYPKITSTRKGKKVNTYVEVSSPTHHGLDS